MALFNKTDYTKFSDAKLAVELEKSEQRLAHLESPNFSDRLITASFKVLGAVGVGELVGDAVAHVTKNDTATYVSEIVGAVAGVMLADKVLDVAVHTGKHRCDERIADIRAVMAAREAQAVAHAH